MYPNVQIAHLRLNDKLPHVVEFKTLIAIDTITAAPLVDLDSSQLALYHTHYARGQYLPFLQRGQN